MDAAGVGLGAVHDVVVKLDGVFGADCQAPDRRAHATHGQGISLGETPASRLDGIDALGLLILGDGDHLDDTVGVAAAIRAGKRDVLDRTTCVEALETIREVAVVDFIGSGRGMGCFIPGDAWVAHDVGLAGPQHAEGGGGNSDVPHCCGGVPKEPKKGNELEKIKGS